MKRSTGVVLPSSNRRHIPHLHHRTLNCRHHACEMSVTEKKLAFNIALGSTWLTSRGHGPVPLPLLTFHARFKNRSETREWGKLGFRNNLNLWVSEIKGETQALLHIHRLTLEKVARTKYCCSPGTFFNRPSQCFVVGPAIIPVLQYKEYT